MPIKQDVDVMQDELLNALTEFLDYLELKVPSQVQSLTEEVEIVVSRRHNGEEWKEIFEDNDLGFMKSCTTLLMGISENSGAVRKSLVVKLRESGWSIPRIANKLNVTHQRISNLLRRIAQEKVRASGR